MLTRSLTLTPTPTPTTPPPRQVKNMTSGKGGAKEFKDYLKIPDEEKKGLSTLSDQKKLDVFQVPPTLTTLTTPTPS